MASAFYAKGKENLLAGNIDFDTDDIKVVLTDDSDYTPNDSTDETLEDVTAAGRVATSANLSSKTVTDGAFDSADVTLSSVSGDQSEQLVLYKASGVESTSYLFCRMDSANVTGLPVTPNGGDITVTWDATGIFSL